MKTTLAWICEMRRQGVRFIDRGGSNLRLIGPKQVLTPAVQLQLAMRKSDILRRLRAGGLSVETVAEVFGEVPVLPDTEVEELKQQSLPRHLSTEREACCTTERWWVSRTGLVLCAQCAPPSDPTHVLGWIPPEGQTPAGTQAHVTNEERRAS